MSDNEEKFTVTLPFMREQFARYNELIFGRKLPEPVFRIYPARRYHGQFRMNLIPGPGKMTRVPQITLSSAKQRTADEHTDTLIHEMIHMALALSDCKETPHGPSFRKAMNTINARFGRNIRISDRKPAAEAEPERPSVKVICVCRMADGETVICTPVRTLVFETNRAMLARRDVRTIDWYVAYTAALNAYPRSRNAALYRIDKVVLESILSSARRYKIAGGRFIPF